MSWWWLSFIDLSKTGPEQFVGVSIVEVEGDPRTLDAFIVAEEAMKKGCHPEGHIEIKGTCMPAFMIPPPEFTYRLLTGDEVRQADAVLTAQAAAHRTGIQ